MQRQPQVAGIVLENLRAGRLSGNSSKQGLCAFSRNIRAKYASDIGTTPRFRLNVTFEAPDPDDLSLIR